MEVETIKTCPLGSQCVEVKEGKIFECRWYIAIQGQDAQGKSQDKKDCAISWMPILQLEGARHGVVNTGSINQLAAAISGKMPMGLPVEKTNLLEQ
jgi:hypothetical protein